MAGGQERILRNRIRSVQATKKITRAMELIAGSRIVKAQQRVHAAVPYSEQITDVVHHLSEAGASSDHPILLGRPEVRSICYVIITADRGLCGGYNSGVLRAAEKEMKADVERGWTTTTVAVGRKAESYLRFRGYPMDRVFTGFSENPTYADAKAIADHIGAAYVEGRVDRVELVYTRFVSAGSQEVVQRPLIPLEWELDERRAGQAEQRRRHGGLRLRARPLGDPGDARPPLRRGPHLRRAAERCGLRAGVPPAGHEGRYRQRRRADQDPLARHEPRPAGLHHHRDHGDRRRCGGAGRRQAGRRQPLLQQGFILELLDPQGV